MSELRQRHPSVILAYFSGAIILTLSVPSPLVTLPSFILAIAYVLRADIQQAKPTVLLKFGLLLPIISVFNAFVNRHGLTVIFSFFGIDISLEALLYGLNAAISLMAVVLWFFLLADVLTTGKLVRLLGRRFPSVSIMTALVFRYVPDTIRHAHELEWSRLGLIDRVRIKERRWSLMIRRLNALFFYTLEDSLVSVLSMRAKGFGTGRYSSYKPQGYYRRDIIYLITMGFLTIFVTYLLLRGAGAFLFYPLLSMPQRAIQNGRYWQLSILALCYYLLPAIASLISRMKEKPFPDAYVETIVILDHEVKQRWWKR